MTPKIQTQYNKRVLFSVKEQQQILINQWNAGRLSPKKMMNQFSPLFSESNIASEIMQYYKITGYSQHVLAKERDY